MPVLHHQTELMNNQKAGSVLPAPNDFECFQNSDNHPILFFIDSALAFQLCAERFNDENGWFMTDLSADISALNSGKTITTKTFDASQDYATGLISIALVVSVAGENDDRLYLLTGLSNAPDASWMTNADDRDWLSRPYDGPTHSGTFSITNVYMKASMDSHIVCEMQDQTTLAITNFKVASSGTANWSEITGADNFTTLLSQVIGKPASAGHPGLYQITEDASSNLALKFLPMQSSDNPITFTVPSGATGIATLGDANGNTDLYVVADGAIYLFPAGTQQNNATGTKIVDHALISNVRNFHSHQNDRYTLLWGLNAQNQVFYAQCEKGNEKNPRDWSTPIPIFDNVVRLSTYFSDTNDHSVVFVHKQDGSLLKYTQDSQTTEWHERSILLPAAKIADHIQFNTFTTHISVAGTDNIPLPGAMVSIQSSSPCNVTINNSSYFLSQSGPLSLATDIRGTLTIIQETQNIAAVCYTVGLVGDDMPPPTVINPMTKANATLTQIQTGTELGAVQVTNSEGVTSPLVAADISSETKDAAAKAIQNFTQLVSSLPANGSTQHTPTDIAAFLTEPYIADQFDPEKHAVWGIDFTGTHARFCTGADAISHFGLNLDRAGRLGFSAPEVGSIWSFVKSVAGDVYQFAKNSVSAVASFVVSHVGSVIKVFVTIGGTIYRFVANCISDVLHAINVVFDKIAVTFEKLIQWLGFVFQWNDIKRTHQVTKNILKQFLLSIPDDIETMKGNLDTVFDQMTTAINSWAQLSTEPGWNTKYGGVSRSISGMGTANGNVPATRSPQANYASYHLNNNLGSAALGSTSYTPPSISQMVQDYVSTISSDLAQEVAAIANAKEAIETDLLGQFDTLSFGDFVKKLLAILADLVVSTVKTVVDVALDLLALLIENVVELLDTPLDIPILSSLYKTATGSTLTILDAFCFVCSLGGTVMFKIIKGAAPFPDNTLTQTLIAANSWTEIKQAFNPPQTPPAIVSGSKKVIKAPAPDKHTNTVILSHLFAVLGANCIIMSMYGDGFTPKAKGVAFFVGTFPDIVRRALSTDPITTTQAISNVVYGAGTLLELTDIAVDVKFSAFKSDWHEFERGLTMFVAVWGIVPAVLTVVDKQTGYTFASGTSSLLYQSNRMIYGVMESPAKNPRLFVARQVVVLAYAIGQLVCAELYEAD